MYIRLVLLLFVVIFSNSCNKNKISKDAVNDKSVIDSLLFKSKDSKTESKLREANADKLFEILKSNENDSVNRSLYFRLADRYYNLFKDNKFKKVSLAILKLSINSKDSLSISKSYKYLGDYNYDLFRKDSAYFFYTKAEKINQISKHKIDLSEIQLAKANILFFEKDFAGSEIAIIKVLKNAIVSDDKRLIYDCYISLGNALDGLNDFEKSLEYYNKAFQITPFLKDDFQYLLLKAQTYNYIGRLYNKNKQYQKAVFYFENGLKFFMKNNFEPYLYANFQNSLGFSNFKLGKKIAILQLNEASKILDSLKNIPGIVSSKINLTEYYLHQKDTLRSFNLALQARKMAHKNNIFEDELKTLKLLSEIDPKNNLVYNNRFIKLTDSLQNNERATRNKFARIEFETDEILNEKKSIEIEKNAISSQRWLILGLSLLTLIVGVLLYLSKMQHAKNKQLQLEKEQQVANEAIYQLMLDQQTKIQEGRNKEKKRISQELHDGIMSKLTSTRLNLWVLSKRNDPETIENCLIHINNIQNIEKEIRAISHDLANDIFTNKDSFKIIIEELFLNQAKISNFDYTLHIDQKIIWEQIASTTKMHLYRIFQESLQNIHKYAQAKNIIALISKNENNIEIEIGDDGIGFDISKIKDGIGLKNMKSRSGLINSQLTIVSNVNKGTKIKLVLSI